MNMHMSITINGSKEETWKVITDIEGSVNTIKGIKQIEILEKPDKGFIGLKWRETRTMFGQTATEVMWITDSVENEYYKTRAESHGAVYTTKMEISGEGGIIDLTMSFNAEIISFLSKLVSALTGWMFKGSMKKAIMEDLNDIKSAVEKGA
jgi:Polyketide cyclase / dehydrase and lipid transport